MTTILGDVIGRCFLFSQGIRPYNICIITCEKSMRGKCKQRCRIRHTVDAYVQHDISERKLTRSSLEKRKHAQAYLQEKTSTLSSSIFEN